MVISFTNNVHPSPSVCKINLQYNAKSLGVTKFGRLLNISKVLGFLLFFARLVLVIPAKDISVGIFSRCFRDFSIEAQTFSYFPPPPFIAGKLVPLFLLVPSKQAVAGNWIGCLGKRRGKTYSGKKLLATHIIFHISSFFTVFYIFHYFLKSNWSTSKVMTTMKSYNFWNDSSTSRSSWDFHLSVS